MSSLGSTDSVGGRQRSSRGARLSLRGLERLGLCHRSRRSLQKRRRRVGRLGPRVALFVVRRRWRRRRRPAHRRRWRSFKFMPVLGVLIANCVDGTRPAANLVEATRRFGNLRQRMANSTEQVIRFGFDVRFRVEHRFLSSRSILVAQSTTPRRPSALRAWRARCNASTRNIETAERARARALVLSRSLSDFPSLLFRSFCFATTNDCASSRCRRRRCR